MKVKDFIGMFEMLQDVEIYPIPHPAYPTEFMYEEDISEERPLYIGAIKDLPYYLLECEITEYEGSSVDVRVYEEEDKGRYPMLVFCVREAE